MTSQTSVDEHGSKEWLKTKTPNLYERRQPNTPKTGHGKFYSRFEVNGRQKSVSLRTNVLTRAKIKHAELMLGVTQQRGRAIKNATDGFQTLGELWTEMKQRYAATVVAHNTAVARANNMNRLKVHWQRGNFETFKAVDVDSEVISELKDFLHSKAKWRFNFGEYRKGYRKPVVEQTLSVLRIMLSIALEKKVVTENQFSVRTVLRSSPGVVAGRRLENGVTEKISIPSRPDMMRIVAEMRNVPAPKNGYDGNPGQIAHLKSIAEELADHTELLIYSGMRKGEAKAAKVEDYDGKELKIRGTKSTASARKIPVNPDLRRVVERLTQRRNGPTDHLVITSEPGRALKRACGRLKLPAMRNHDLRHFFASACIASGVDIITIAHWMGHTDAKQIFKTYGHLLKDHSERAAQTLNFNGST